MLQSDAIGRQMMEPGQSVYAAIAAHFGESVVSADGTLDRRALARIGFAEGRVEELNAIVHPAVIARQAELSEAIYARDPEAVVIIESALIFETNYGGATRWQSRFDRIILVTAPEEVKIERFVARAAPDGHLSEAHRAELEVEARRSLSQQIPDEKRALCATTC